MRFLLGMTMLILSTGLSATPTMVSTRITAEADASPNRLGYGYFSATGRFSAVQCVEGTPENVDIQAGTLRWTWDEGTDYSERHQQRRDSVIGDAHYAIASAEGSSIGLTSIDASSFVYTIIGRLEVNFPGPKLSINNMKLNAKSSQWSKSPAEFFARCGDRFVVESYTGGAIYVVASLITDSNLEIQDVSTHLRAAVDSEVFGGSVTADASRYLSQLQQSGRLSIKVTLKGPVGAFKLVPNAPDVEPVLAHPAPSLNELLILRQFVVGTFAAQASEAKYRVPIAYNVVDFALLDLKPLQVPQPLKEVVASIEVIDGYLADIDTIRATADASWPRSYLFFGPIDRRALASERDTWLDYGKELVDGLHRCDANDVLCFSRILQKIPALIPAPRPGLIFDVYVKDHGEAQRIDLRRAERTILLRGDRYTSPLNILIKGEWTQRWSSEMKEIERCTGPFAPYVEFSSGEHTFSVATDGGKAFVQAITGREMRKPSMHRGGQDLAEDLYVIEGWPADKPLSAMLVDNRGYIDNQICPRDRPFILIWQNDKRFNSSDPYAAADYVAP